MVKIFKFSSIFLFVLFTQFVMAEETESQVTTKNKIATKMADINHFSGYADFSRFPVMPSNGNVEPAIVNFQPNGFTDWHSHSQGQYLIVTEGTGRFQEWGKPVQIVTKGDVVWIPPNIKHWHGAGEYTAMSHVAISPVKGNSVTWMEKVQQKKHKIQFKLIKL